MSSQSPQEHQRFKEFLTPFHPQGRVFYGFDLRGTQCDRAGDGTLRLVGYGDSSGGYAFTPNNQDAAIAPSLGSANLSNISRALPRLTEMQDYGGKWIDTVTLHALDEFIEQVQPQSFIANTFRIFAGSQKGYRGDGTGNRQDLPNTYTLLAEIPIPALTRLDVPRSFTVKVGAYVAPAQNIYLGLAIPQPYSCSFELWDLQANTLVGSGISSSIGGSSSVGNGNDLNEDDPNPSNDFTFVLPIDFASATWALGGRVGIPSLPFNGGDDGSDEPDNETPPPPNSPPSLSVNGSSNDGDEDQPSPDSPSSPSAPSSSGGSPVPPPSQGGCTPIQDCNWHRVSAPQSASVDINNTGSLDGGTSLCPKGTVARGIIDFASSGSFVLCCGAATFPPNGLGCSSLMKWSCVSGGSCVEDASGTYNSQAECQAALVPANFTGGQCAGVAYTILLNGTVTYADNGDFFVTYTDRNEGTRTGPLSNLRVWARNTGNSLFLTGTANGVPFESFLASTGGNNRPLNGSGVSITVNGSPNNCGNPPPSCP